MRLKVYRARTLPEAMARVRAELGGDALILGSRRVADGVELTAALEPDNNPLPKDRKFGALSLYRGARPLLLTGPPGGGKTLTVVRLATRLTLAGLSPMVITADGHKAGATEQLAAFTRLLGVGLTVATDPLTVSRALLKRKDGVPVLIDGTGSNPFNPIQADELRAMIAAANACVALVLPAGLDPEEAADLAGAYASIGADMLIATRLDLTHRMGGILAAADAGALALAEAGIGPGAADGLVPFTPDFLTDRLSKIRTPRNAA